MKFILYSRLIKCSGHLIDKDGGGEKGGGGGGGGGLPFAPFLFFFNFCSVKQIMKNKL